MASAERHRWMAEALRLARKGLCSTHPNPRVGCVVVSEDRLVARGWHEYAGGPHAEINAIESASIPEGADFYVTLEPCAHHGRTPPCVDALLEARPARVFVAMQDPNPEVGGRGLETLKSRGIEVVCGLLEAEARALNPGFCKRMEQGLPLVTIKMASSLDGRSALRNGASQWITGDAARRDVQFLRARSSAILTSAQTVLADDPSLDVRLSKAELGQACDLRDPVRVVIDSALRLAGNEKIFTTKGDIWIYTLSDDAARTGRLVEQGATVVRLDAADSAHADLAAVLGDLAARGINEVHTECGQGLAGALLGRGLADRIVLYLAPHLLGSAARGIFDLGELTAMDQRIGCELEELRQVGDDLRLSLSVNREATCRPL